KVPEQEVPMCTEVLSALRLLVADRAPTLKWDAPLKRILATMLLAGAITTIASSPARGGGPCPGDPGFTLQVPPEAPIGEFIDICMDARAGDLVALLGSLGQGPTATPFGTFCLDFPPLVMFTFVMPPGGNRCFHRYIVCDPSAVGMIGYLQFLAVDPGVGADG